MTIQRQNTQLVSLLTPWFLRRKEFYEDPARIPGIVLMPQRGGGGQLRWAWVAQSVDNWGRTKIGAQWWSWNNIGADDFAITGNAGPYVDFDGATENLYLSDHSSQETGSETFFVWAWCNPSSLAANAVIASKYDVTAGNNVSWVLFYNNTVNRFRWLVNGTGNPANNVTVDDTVAPSTGTWYFVCGYYEPSTRIRIGVATPADATVRYTTQAAGVPASLFNGTADLTIGSTDDPASWWAGYIGPTAGWSAVPAGGCNEWATRIFHATRLYYAA